MTELTYIEHNDPLVRQVWVHKGRIDEDQGSTRSIPSYQKTRTCEKEVLDKEEHPGQDIAPCAKYPRSANVARLRGVAVMPRCQYLDMSNDICRQR
jgi:hypothetical protein